MSMLDSRKWRVRRFKVQAQQTVRLVVPWQLRSALVPSVEVDAWGIWPPNWNINKAPLLLFPKHSQAFSAAYDRAQFAHAPTPPREGIDG